MPKPAKGRNRSKTYFQPRSTPIERKIRRAPPHLQRKLKSYAELEKSIRPREYTTYKREKEAKLNWFEKYTNASTKFIKVNPDKGTRESLEEAIRFTGLRTSPTAVMSGMVFSLILFLLIGIVSLFILGFGSYLLTVLLIIIGFVFGYSILKYPINMVKTIRIRSASQMVLAILYMVVSMRISPNLERALKFAAKNITGELAWDMRRILWGIQLRKYNSAEEAIASYIVRWKAENEEFSEALRLIRDSEYQPPDRAEATLDQALNIILEGTKTRMKHYTQDLRMPVMVIHMMGIILPVLGTIMAPLVAVFMGGAIGAHHFIIAYDIVLPLVILWFINSTLRKRPVTFSQIDTSKHPDIPPKGSFLVGKKSKSAFPALPIALIVLIAILTPAIYYFVQNPNVLIPPPGAFEKGDQFPVLGLMMSIFIILGIALSIAVYYLLTTFQANRIQKKIENTESEFELALFKLGNRVGAGVPAEVAMQRAIGDMKDLAISDLFVRALTNIKRQGMTLDKAFFDKTYGAIRYYPSRLIKNIMSAVVDTAKRGIGYASESMMTISKYLSNIRETQEYIRDMLSETVSSMKFQAYILTPMITGLIVSMSQVITDVLVKLGQGLASAGVAGATGVADTIKVKGIFGDVDKAIPPGIFQLIVGVYLIEVVLILAIFLTKIHYGDNKIIQRNTAAKMLIVSMVVYVLISVISSLMFAGLIRNALSGIVGG